jgi:hypothetical protein
MKARGNVRRAKDWQEGRCIRARLASGLAALGGNRVQLAALELRQQRPSSSRQPACDRSAAVRHAAQSCDRPAGFMPA